MNVCCCLFAFKAHDNNEAKSIEIKYLGGGLGSKMEVLVSDLKFLNSLNYKWKQP